MRVHDTPLVRAAVIASTICRSLLAPGEGGAFEEVFLDGALVGGIGFVVLEACGEFVGVVEDVLD